MIQIQNLSMKYDKKYAFRDICLPIHPGLVTAIVGPSGCGKTSFLMCLNKLVEMIPQCEVIGRVEIDSTNIVDSSDNSITLRKRIGMIFQKPNPFPFSIRKNISLALSEHGMKDRKTQDQKIEKVLREVGLWQEVKDRLNSSAHNLSGGQQQRLCIARALALEPEVLLMDEPCSALDPIASGIVEDLISSLKGLYTIVIVTHNLAQARRIADYVAFFWNQDGAGKLIEFGPAPEIFEKPKEALTASYFQGIRG